MSRMMLLVCPAGWQESIVFAHEECTLKLNAKTMRQMHVGYSTFPMHDKTAFIESCYGYMILKAFNISLLAV